MDSQTISLGPMPSVAIVLLNWNGADDTLACLKSLSKLDYQNVGVVLVDNASTDDSLALINDYITNGQTSDNARMFVLGGTQKIRASDIELTIICNSENQGFAKGNNTGMSVAMEGAYDYMLLLNNDTEVTPDFLTIMMQYHLNHPDIGVSCPQIRYFDKEEIIWNCGGELTAFGAKKYCYEGQKPANIKEKESIAVSFITGCALLASAALFRKYGMLSEAFFFGEEDYEFSLRMKKQGIQMVCVTQAVIYHKVSSSSSRASSQTSGRIFIHYLNRFINLRSFMPPWKWHLWRFAFLHYVALVLYLKHHQGFGRSLRVVRKLWTESARLNSVNKTTFETYFSSDFQV